MSETTTNTDSTNTTAPSSSADAPAPAPSTGAPAPDSTAPSSGNDSKSPSSGDSRKSDRDELLSAVLKAVPTKPEAPAVPTGDEPVADADPEGKDGKDQTAADTDQGKTPAPGDPSQDKDENRDPTEAELKKLRPETRRRFEALLSQRNEARQAFEAAQPELNAHRQLQGFLRENQLAADDVNRLLGVGSALRKGDYRAFLEGVTPYVVVAQEALGFRISPDLQKQVDEGVLNEDAARELTRTRHQARRAETELTTTREANTAEARQRNVGAIKSAIDNWETSTRSSDPDYAHKAVAVRRFSQALMQERGIPANEQQAVELVKAAYEEATREMMRGRPAPQPTRKSPSGIQTTTTGPAAREPANMKDAVIQTLASMRRAS